ncbi:unnamed protein product [Tuber aestivum]|uniref:Uncharacterized protein n=1 Tax=Tuber aestivum TaxID=59557 RepID=A0A292Q6L0_9PEZI|nr:unnamed protein product [Tuber aestivum]
MVPSTRKEVQQPQRKVPRAIVLPVAAAGMTGVVLFGHNIDCSAGREASIRICIISRQQTRARLRAITVSASGGFGLFFFFFF